MITLLARSTQTNHAEIASSIRSYGVESGLLPAAWDASTAAGAIALNAEITRQAMVIAYVNDFWLLMILTIVAIPLVYLLRSDPRGGPAPAPVIDH